MRSGFLLLPLLLAFLVFDKNLTRRARRAEWVRALRGDLEAVAPERAGLAEDEGEDPPDARPGTVSRCHVASVSAVSASTTVIAIG